MTAAKPETMKATKDFTGSKYAQSEGAVFDVESQTDADELERYGVAVRLSDEKK